MDKLSYALGLSMGHNFLGSGIKSLNVEDFAKGVEAVYKQEKPEISFDEAKKIINEFFSNLQDEIAETNKQAGKEFLAENAKRSGVVVLPSGLQYEVLAEGKGRKPKATDKVQCHYHGTLIDGQVFDNQSSMIMTLNFIGSFRGQPSDTRLGGSLAVNARRFSLEIIYTF